MRRRLGALFAMAALALAVGASFVAPASAQTPVFSCNYTINPGVLPPGGGLVTVSGVAPGSSVVRVFVDGVLVATTTSAPVTGEWSVTISITGTAEVSVALDDYPSTPCIVTGGGTVDRGGTLVRAAGQTRLALTGSSATQPIVLVALGAVSVGLVLVVASRRRLNVQGRD